MKKSRKMTAWQLCLTAMAVAVNIAGGQIALLLRLPVYLDSIGTILVGAVLALRYIVNDQICGEDDVVKALGVPVFCSIPENGSMSKKDHRKNRRKG